MKGKVRIMTKREMYENIKTLLADNEEVVAFCDHEIELADKRKERKSSKPSAKQIENENLKVEICGILDNVETPVTATEIKDELNPELKVQRVSALLSQLIKEEEVVKTYSGKVALFARA